MKLILLFACLSVCLFGQEEFLGPFASWANVRTYGAHGDGVTDDTAALQAAFADLGTSGHSPVLFIPAGTYCLNSTWILANKQGISIVGQDPSTTTLKRCGASADTLVNVNGVDYMRFERLTLDGNRKASIALDQAWDATQPYFDTGNQYVDLWIENANTGYRCGALGQGCAETTFLRGRFSGVGTCASLLNFNALDIWFWYTRFDHCSTGVTNELGAGNFHVYESLFLSSGVTDLAVGNTGIFSFRGNYSSGSNAFFQSWTDYPYPMEAVFQRNVVLSSGRSSPVVIGNQGPVLLDDNKIRSLATPIDATSTRDTDVTAVGNLVSASSMASVRGRSISIDNDESAPMNSFNIPEPELPRVPPPTASAIFDVPPGANAATIAGIVQQALALTGSRPVVHFPYGTYSATISTPAGADVRFVGDGLFFTTLNDSDAVHPTLAVQGPSRVEIQDLLVQAPGLEAIRVTGASVFSVDVSLRANQVNLLSSAGVIEMHDAELGQATQTDISVQGGEVRVLSAASCCDANTVALQSGKLLLRDTWYEGGAPNPFAGLSGSGVFTMEAVQAAASGNTVAANGFHGPATAMFGGIFGNFSASGVASSASQFTALGLVAQSGTFYSNSTSAPEPGPVLSRLQTAGGGSSRIANGVFTSASVLNALAYARSVTPGVRQGVILTRAGASNSAVGLHIQ